jgi:hypothetical protein
MSRLFKTTLLALGAVLVAGAPVRSAAPAPPKESEVKAVLLFQLTRFVTWPQTTLTNEAAPYVIGVLGPDPFDGALDAVVKGEKVGSHPITILRAATVRGLTNCQMVYVSPEAREPLPKIFEMWKAAPTLTVGESGDFISRGGMIRFKRSADHKVRLEIDLDRVRLHAISVSAQLLRVCDVLGGGNGK